MITSPTDEQFTRVQFLSSCHSLSKKNICWISVYLDLASLCFPSSDLPKPKISAETEVLTVKDQVKLQCKPPESVNVSQCHFNYSSQSAHLNPVKHSKEEYYTVTVSGAVLLKHNASFKSHTHISCRCTWNNNTIISENISLLVFNFGEFFFSLLLFYLGYMLRFYSCLLKHSIILIFCSM